MSIGTSPKICVGLSGGVDSSVAALLLKRQGYDVFAMFMQNWHDADATLHGDCEWEEERFVAEMVARKIGIPFYFVDLSETYRKRVVDYMFDEYAKGRTPNPDVLCNREIKFDAFLEVARKMGADMVATGHYCRKEAFTGPDGRVSYRLLAGADPDKDQSYFLCQLSQEQLSRALFPIGDLTKPEVRRIAREADLPSADKKDSQGICFVGKVDLPTFLKQKLAPSEGEVIEVYDAYFSGNERYAFVQDTLSSLLRHATAFPDAASLDSSGIPASRGGAAESPFDPAGLAALPDDVLLELSKPLEYDLSFETEEYRSGRHRVKKIRYKENPAGAVIGKHEGAQFYTIGQRKGLNIGGHKEPVFVIATDMEKNRIYVGEGHGHKGLLRSLLHIAPDEIHEICPGSTFGPYADSAPHASALVCDADSAPHASIGDESGYLGVSGMRRCKVRIRYRQPLQDATLIMRESGLFILFDTPQRGITPGQFAVWYDGPELLGSGVIS